MSFSKYRSVCFGLDESITNGQAVSTECPNGDGKHFHTYLVKPIYLLDKYKSMSPGAVNKNTRSLQTWYRDSVQSANCTDLMNRFHAHKNIKCRCNFGTFASSSRAACHNRWWHCCLEVLRLAIENGIQQIKQFARNSSLGPLSYNCVLVMGPLHYNAPYFWKMGLRRPKTTSALNNIYIYISHEKI